WLARPRLLGSSPDCPTRQDHGGDRFAIRRRDRPWREHTMSLANNARLDRRYFIGGSDARIIMGEDEAALARLWREKRGEVEPEDLSGNLIGQLGIVTE